MEDVRAGKKGARRGTAAHCPGRKEILTFHLLEALLPKQSKKRLQGSHECMDSRDRPVAMAWYDLAAARPAGHDAFRRVGALAAAFGVEYRIFGDWLDVVIRKAWADTGRMPAVRAIAADLAPLVQRMAALLAKFWRAARFAAAEGQEWCDA